MGIVKAITSGQTTHHRPGVVMIKHASIILTFVLLLVRCSTPSNSVLETKSLTGPQRVPNSIGITVHTFTDTNLDRAAQAGFGIVRMDLEWAAVEEIKGQYNWSDYDTIVNRLEARGLRPMFILDFNNPLYGKGHMDGIDTAQERTGFQNFAVAAVKRYQQRINPIWEMYNEPNRPTFWSNPSAEAYVKLVNAVVPAMRQAQPNLLIIGPALGHAPNADPDKPIKVDFEYLESSFALGILDHIDAVSIHPYPDGQPELALGIYDSVRKLMNSYAPGKNIPIVSSEWGYSTGASYSNTEALQANFLTRMHLINLSQNVVSIGYKLEYGSPDPDADAYELGFSWFKSNPQANLVYNQVQTMISRLEGLSFVQRLPSADSDYFMEFSDGTKTVTAAWTSEAAHTVTVYGRSVRLDGNPVYLIR
jgi:polysaccharide biosynthesis protein PslG